MEESVREYMELRKFLKIPVCNDGAMKLYHNRAIFFDVDIHVWHYWESGGEHDRKHPACHKWIPPIHIWKSLGRQAAEIKLGSGNFSTTGLISSRDGELNMELRESQRQMKVLPKLPFLYSHLKVNVATVLQNT